MASANDIISLIQSRQDTEEFQQLNWKGTFEDYLSIVTSNPAVVRTSYQRIYDMIMSYGTEEYTEHKRKIVRYKFFDDVENEGADAVYGLELPLMKLVNVFKSAAQRLGTERRIILLHGPVGSSKSTIVRRLKRGLEVYSKCPEGALYTFAWRDESDGGERFVDSPMHEDPLKLIPIPFRPEVEAKINSVVDDPKKVIEHIQVRRLILSEKDRVGIGTFQPKDEKNQDSTELTGDINYRKIAEYGSDSDPRAFNFDGEFNVANRGLIEFIEVLKLDVAFLYDLLGASQEHKIKPKKFSQTDIDEVIIGHTNEPEYRKLQNNEFMEALRDRTVKIDIPYITKLVNEVKIYERDFNAKKIPGVHIAPHTIEMASMWAVLTRMEEPKKASLNLLQKLKLYNGQTLPGFTEENIKELKKETEREGMEGISPRYIQDKISNTLVDEEAEGCINPFMVMNELEAGLDHHSLITSDEERKRFRELLGMVKEEYEDIVKNEVQRAISADEEAIKRLCANYVDNIKAYTQKEKVKNKFTGADEEPDERLMRSIEEKIGIPENRKDDFRREIMNYIGALAVEGKTFDYTTNARLQKALELKLFEDQKDTIKLTNLVTNVVDKETQAKIDVVKQRLIRNFGYNEVSATDVLNFVASIFARGDTKEQS
jgi:serine protein kinase